LIQCRDLLDSTLAVERLGLDPVGVSAHSSPYLVRVLGELHCLRNSVSPREL
jgi:hypothetical protein